MSTEAHKALLQRVRDEVYAHGNVDAMDLLVVDDVLAHEPDGDVRGVEDVKRYLASFLTAFPDTDVTVEDTIAEGDKVVSRYTSRGTHTGTTEEYGPPTGNVVELEGITIYRFTDGRVTEMWDRYDTLAVMKQMGLRPEGQPEPPG